MRQAARRGFDRTPFRIPQPHYPPGVACGEGSKATEGALSPIQNNSEPPQGRRGAFAVTLNPSSGHAPIRTKS